jgi:hypothetical protein
MLGWTALTGWGFSLLDYDAWRATFASEGAKVRFALSIWKLTAGVLSACLTLCATEGAAATPDQELIQALQISGDTFMISAQADAVTDRPDAYRRYALAKIAQATLDSGYDLFQFTDLAGRSVSASIKPGQSLLVKMSNYPAPNPLPLGMYDAHKFLDFARDSAYAPPQPSR